MTRILALARGVPHERPKSRTGRQGSTVFRIVARIGYVVLGILHIVIGVIAISFLTGRRR